MLVVLPLVHALISLGDFLPTAFTTDFTSHVTRIFMP